MWIIEFLIISACSFLLIYLIVIYNGLVRLKNNVDRCFANIEVVLKQRHTELPRLVEICQGIMKHERELLVNLVNARERLQIAQDAHDIPALGNAETLIRRAVGQLFVRVEAYPELKANQNLLELQERISHLEDAIADRRELFNESVRLNNTRIQQFPDTLLARSFKFSELDYLQFEAEAIAQVKLNLD